MDLLNLCEKAEVRHHVDIGLDFINVFALILRLNFAKFGDVPFTTVVCDFLHLGLRLLLIRKVNSSLALSSFQPEYRLVFQML
jgi:hypothetical protein